MELPCLYHQEPRVLQDGSIVQCTPVLDVQSPAPSFVSFLGPNFALQFGGLLSEEFWCLLIHYYLSGLRRHFLTHMAPFPTSICPRLHPMYAVKHARVCKLDVGWLHVPFSPFFRNTTCFWARDEALKLKGHCSHQKLCLLASF